MYRVPIVDPNALKCCLQGDLAREAVLYSELNHSNQRQFKIVKVTTQNLWKSVVMDEAEYCELMQTDRKPLYGGCA